MQPPSKTDTLKAAAKQAAWMMLIVGAVAVCGILAYSGVDMTLLARGF